MRPLKALCIVVILVVSVPLIGLAFPENSAQEINQIDSVGIAASDVANAQSIDDFLANLESLADQNESVPTWFKDEIGLLPDARNVRVSGPVVGYVIDEDSNKVMSLLQQDLSERGWKAVSLGEVEGATFMKSSGVCTWVLVTCTQVDKATSVVVRCNVA